MDTLIKEDHSAGHSSDSLPDELSHFLKTSEKDIGVIPSLPQEKQDSRDSATDINGGEFHDGGMDRHIMCSAADFDRMPNIANGHHSKSDNRKAYLKKQKSMDKSSFQNSVDDYFPEDSDLRTHSHNDSSWSLFSSVSHAHPAITPRDNKCSMKRRQMAVQRSNTAPIDENAPTPVYQTPLQRKEQQVKELRKELQESYDKLRQKDKELQDIMEKKDSDCSDILGEKDQEIYSLRDQNTAMQREIEQLQEQRDELVFECDQLKVTMEENEKEQEKKDAMHKEMYLKMYEKGVNSAMLERQDTLEEIAKENPETVSVPELLEKLRKTEVKLAQVQSANRYNRYQEAAKLSPKTESEATLQCVRDALYHYLTSEKETKKQHLLLLLSLSGFTAVQKKKIDKSLAKAKSQRSNSSS